MATKFRNLLASIFSLARWRVILLLPAICLPISSAMAASESLGAIEKRGKVIARSAMYGLAGGLVVGLASQVVKSKVKNIFVGGSLGLYAGILMGVYLTSTARDNMNYEGPDTYEDYGDFSKATPEPDRGMQKINPSAQKLEMNLVSLRF